MELEFWKLSGAGNDFIVMNNMDGHIPEAGRRELLAAWCRRGASVGADGVLLVEPSQRAHFRMRYYNADGGEAETCGNGSRCIARFAHLQGVAPERMQFETLAGIYEAEIMGEDVAVRMTDAHGLRMNIEIPDGGPYAGPLHFVNTGVPHAVILMDDLAGAEVVKAGRYVRYHGQFAPAGTNVNFAHVTGLHDIKVRTYERGVEDETLACGTGSIASAIICAQRGLAQPPVRVLTASGETLTIGFELTPGGGRGVTLQGSARVVFRGYLL